MSTDITLFSQIVAHELRSPIASAFEALRMTGHGANSELHDFRELALESLSRAERIVSSLTDLARCEALDSGCEPVDVTALVRELLSEVESPGPETALRVSVEPNMGCTRANPAVLALTFKNLISNALHHNRHLGDLHVEIGRNPGGAGYYVRDNGVGIRNRDQLRIFQSFSRGDAVRVPGMGLGLHIARSAVEQLGGEMWIESTYGAGSTFRFTLDRRGPGPARTAN